MTDSSERAFAEALEWLESSKATLLRSEHDSAAVTVACAQAIHCMIRANDGLCLKFLGRKATRHDDAPALFRLLVKNGLLRKEDESLSSVLVNAVSKKSGADYGKASFSLKDAKKLVADAEQFFHAAKKYA